ncbi:MAG: carboxypeptidase-like regulatory domain-containing protein [Ignavibacteriales bacterium]|nr:carboxypeptidase-like regulatory domain-containing protein [Ignavibacteriales bacterium]
MRFNKLIIPFLLFILLNNSFAQNGETTLNGFVYDASNGEALIGANIYLKEVSRGASTNVSGYYVIPNLQPGTYELTVSYIGYKTFSQRISIKAGEEKRIDVSLSTEVLTGEEVVVTADSIRTIDKLFNKPVSKIDLSPVQLGKVPQAVESDLLRTLQSLPGIVPLSDFSSAIYVRGGTPDQNLFLVDGTDVYNPEHAFGLFSTFNTDAIKKVEVYKGGFGAEYGGRLSSVINITNNDGNRNEFEGKVSVSLLSVNTTLQTPIGSIGSLSGSLRRTYIDQTVAKIIDDVPNYYFLDGNIKAFFDIDNSNKLSVSFYGGIDDLDFVLDKERAQSLGFDYVWGNQTGSINWRTIISPKVFGNFWITASRFFSDFDFDDVEFTEKNRIRDVTFKGAVEYFYSDQLNFKFGFEQKNVSGGLKQDFIGGKVDVAKFRRLFSTYFTTTWQPNILWNIEAGLRADYFDSDVDYKNLDPRLSIKYRLTETSNLKFSTGLFHQYANRIPRLFFVSIWTTADEYIEGSSAAHFILGYQKEIAQNIEFEAEAYYKDYSNIYSYNPAFLADISADGYSDENEPLFNTTKGLFNKGNGNSLGIELLLRKDVGAITGWAAYSFAKTEYTIDRVNSGKAFNPRHDRTHSVNLVANFDLNNVFNELHGRQFVQSDKTWMLGFNFTYFSGQPITLPSSVYVINQAPDWDLNQNSPAIYPSGINEFRLPYYARLDFSLTYEIQYDGWSLAPYLQIFNMLNRKNVWFIEYENKIKEGILTQKVENVNMFPILPSIGVSIKF